MVAGAPNATLPRVARPARVARSVATPDDSRASTPLRDRSAAASVILGIDPGTRVVGWGVIELSARGPRLVAAGVIRAKARELPERLGLIRAELDQLIDRYRPSAMAVEEAFAHKNIQSALRIGEARGVVLSCASTHRVSVHQYPPASAKKALVGNGMAHKSQVAAMVARQLELTEAPKPWDASDALALALTHMLRGSVRTAVARIAGSKARSNGRPR